jgi:Cu(I)/Ag(I) efflux system membrane fusion protein
MDLIPVEPEQDEQGVEGRTISFSEASVGLMEIETSKVARRQIAVEVELVGRVTYDAGRLAVVSAWVPGRIERLHVDRVGQVVREGEPLLDLYGSELMAAQRELVAALLAHREANQGGGEGAASGSLEVLQAVRERLSLWGVSPEQVSRVEDSGTVESRMTIVSPLSGTVVEEHVAEGQHVPAGGLLFTVADLSRVWIDLAAHETDLSLLREGQELSFSAAALPGRIFEGVLTLVEPIVDPKTRTVTVRAEVNNVGGELKPDMYVSATVLANANAEGDEPPLVIPASAPLLTGKRAVVYVQKDSAERPTFEGREVTLGPRAGDYYVVVSGLAPGERVVTNGAFKIDSALEIRAMPSMMSSGEEGPADSHQGHSH